MADQLDRLKAALADRYRIERELGSGGMATVYLAEDLKHHRKVAVKVLRAELAATLGPDRFLREIEIAARLQHPHILPLYDSGQADEFLYYVMPFIEGESLRGKLGRERELPVADATKILREVVDALAHAHEHGVVHRDIKPDNVMLSGGHAIVTDFGVAKAVSEATGRHELTSAGVALGTPTYMSPEQTTADPHIDHRADIYAVGAMAYEMLAGRPPFTGNTPQAILSAHITEKPEPISKHRASVSRELEQLVMRCLEKRAADRWQTTKELLPQLEALTTPSGGITPTDTQSIRARKGLHVNPRRVFGTVAGVAVLAVAGFALLGRTPSRLQPGRITHVTAVPGLEVDPAISPDANTIAYAAGSPGQMRIFLSPIAGGRTIALAENLPEHHRWPQWSPDGSQIVFQAGGDFVETGGGFLALGGAVYVVPALGGAARRIVEPALPTSVFAPAWSPDGQHVAFVRDTSIVVVPVAGGNSRTVVDGYQIHSVRWSPDGRWIVYVSGNPQFTFGTSQIANRAPTSLWLVPAAGGDPIRLTSIESMDVSPVWMPDSRSLLFVSNREGGRDVYRLRIAWSGRPDGEAERLTTGLDAHTIALAADGRTLAYSVYTSYSHIWWVRFPRGEAVSVSEATQLTFARESIEGLALSPDGRWVAYDSDRSGNFDAWRISVDGGAAEQVTRHPSDDFLQQWSPDGSELAIHSFRNGNRDVFVIPSSGGTVTPVTDGPAQELNPTWSPDGNSLAFQSDLTGRSEIYAVSRPSRGQPWGGSRRLTTEGGLDPYWSPDGTRIAYIWDRALRVMSSTGTDHRIIVQSPDPSVQPVPEFAMWSTDSHSIYYKAYDADRGSSIWSVPAEGGTPRLLVRFDDANRPSYRREFATDGERIYFSIARHESDVWVMELVENRARSKR